MRVGRGPFIILAGVIGLYAVLLVYPVLQMVEDSFRTFESGRVGSAKDAEYTLDNYVELFHQAYFFYFLDTFRISLIACVITTVLAYPIAYHVARRPAGMVRTGAIGFLISLMFLSMLVRVYSLELTFGSVGLMRPISTLLGVSGGSRIYIEFLVVLGLLHYTIPMSALILIGTIQNVSPRLVEAAQSLGAAEWKAHLHVTIPLSVRGILAAFLISYMLSISAFVIPMILGRGRVVFISNLIYSRYSEVANYPSGSAISVMLMLISFATVYLISRIATQRWEKATEN